MFWWKYCVSVWWGNRQCGIDSCADALLDTLFELKHIHSCFDDWRYPDLGGDVIQLNKMSLQSVLKRGIEQDFELSRRDRQRFGYRLCLNSGTSRDEWIAIHVLCESTLEAAVNHVQVMLPNNTQKGTIGYDVVWFSRVLGILSRIWRPAWGNAAPTKLFSVVRHGNYNHPCVGWLTYLAKPHTCRGDLPAGVTKTPIDNLGEIVVLTTERFSLDNRKHMELQRSVQERIDLGRDSREA